jgi:hypothetical protein
MGVSALPHEKMLRSIELLGIGVAPIVRKQLTTVLSHGVFLADDKPFGTHDKSSAGELAG